LLRLESTTVVCFVGVTAIPVSAVLRLEFQRLAASVDLLVTSDEGNKGVSARPLGASAAADLLGTPILTGSRPLGRLRTGCRDE